MFAVLLAAKAARWLLELKNSSMAIIEGFSVIIVRTTTNATRIKPDKEFFGMTMFSEDSEVC